MVVQKHLHTEVWSGEEGQEVYRRCFRNIGQCDRFVPLCPTGCLWVRVTYQLYLQISSRSDRSPFYLTNLHLHESSPHTPSALHPRKTSKTNILNPKMEVWKIIFLFKRVIFRFQLWIFGGVFKRTPPTPTPQFGQTLSLNCWGCGRFLGLLYPMTDPWDDDLFS